MLKYLETLVTFLEVPDELSLCINITNCPCHCKGCSEPWLADDIGEPLTIEAIGKIMKLPNYLTCICLMGGDNDYDSLAELCQQIKTFYPHLKIAFYSGREQMNEKVAALIDYYKVGPWIESFGPLNKPTTNQKMFQKINGSWVDITYKFQKERE